MSEYHNFAVWYINPRELVCMKEILEKCSCLDVYCHDTLNLLERVGKGEIDQISVSKDKKDVVPMLSSNSCSSDTKTNRGNRDDSEMSFVCQQSSFPTQEDAKKFFNMDERKDLVQSVCFVLNVAAFSRYKQIEATKYRHYLLNAALLADERLFEAYLEKVVEKSSSDEDYFCKNDLNRIAEQIRKISLLFSKGKSKPLEMDLLDRYRSDNEIKDMADVLFDWLNPHGDVRLTKAEEVKYVTADQLMSRISNSIEHMVEWWNSLSNKDDYDEAIQKSFRNLSNSFKLDGVGADR